MTTPAINVTNLTTASGTSELVYHYCDGHTTSGGTVPGKVFARRSETRPASVNHPKNRSGWRVPGAWSHTKIVDNPNPPGTLRLWTQLPSGGCFAGAFSDRLNGYDWALDGTGLPAFPSYLEGRAVSRALLKLKHQSVNLAVAFAERKQTKELFANSAKSIANSVNAFKSRHPKEWGSIVKGKANKGIWKRAPNSWLELQYGWKPLISDVTGACQALDTLESASNPYLAKVSAVTGAQTTLNWRKTCYSTFYGFNVTDLWDHRCRVSLYYKLRNPTLARFASLGLTNPFELAWEKLKYSFVIDWFLPVGNWLSTLDADFGWDFHSGTLTKFSRGGSTSYFKATGLSPGIQKVEWFGPSYAARGFSMSRTVYNSAPWGGIPRFKNPLSSQHIANAMSLLTQAFRR